MIIDATEHRDIGPHLFVLREDGSIMHGVQRICTETLSYELVETPKRPRFDLCSPYYTPLEPTDPTDPQRGTAGAIVWHHSVTIATVKALVLKHPDLAGLKYRTIDGQLVDGARAHVKHLPEVTRFSLCKKLECGRRRVGGARGSHDAGAYCALHMPIGTGFNEGVAPLAADGSPPSRGSKLMAVFDSEGRQAIFWGSRRRPAQLETDTGRVLSVSSTAHSLVGFIIDEAGQPIAFNADETAIRLASDQCGPFWPIDSDAPSPAVAKHLDAADLVSSFIPIQPGIFG